MPKMDSPAMAIILERMGKKKEAEAPEMEMEMEDEVEDESEMSEGEMAAVEEMMSAMDAKDPKAFAEALKSFLEICS